jgi:intein/homing endonuclease
MITKLATFRGLSLEGEPLVQVFHPGDSLKKIAGVIMPEVGQWLSSYRKEEGKIAVLVNAMGASEYWGQNINGDIFYESALVHDCRNHPSTAHPVDNFTGKVIPAYGYWTFLNALPFCFPAGTPVVLGNRIRVPIEEVVTGDIVATSVGPRPVSRIMRRRYKGPGISLHLRGEFDPLIGTEEHPVLVYRRGQIHCACKYSRLGFSDHAADCRSFRDPIGDPQWLSLSDVLPGDYLVLPQPEHGEEEIDPNFAELVGWVASEGYIGKRGLIQFTFSENNKTDLDAVYRCLELNGLHVTVTPRPQYGLTMLSACSSVMSEELQTYVTGVKNEKSLTNRILNWSHSSLLKMLGAYIDGDGHVPNSGRNRGQLRIRSSSVQMLRVLSDVIRSLGIPATVQWDREAGEMVSPTNGKIYQGNGSGVVSVTPGWAPEITVHSRKHRVFEMVRDNRQKMLGKTFLVQVTEKDEIYLDEEVFNLEVPGPHDYVANEVLVHNCHHKNKDPTRTFGKVVVACWNARMRRVELVVVIDRALAMQHGAQHVVDRIDAGEYPDVSMGTRVPYDICVLCQNKSRTRDDYCSCVKNIGMGKILDDGRQIGVINPHPRFFDISFVFIGADKTAKMMCKLGSAEVNVPQSVLDADYIYGESPYLTKAAEANDPDIELNKLVRKGPAVQLCLGKNDTQETPGRSAVGDGTLRTNIAQDERDTYPKPLTPGRGKMASALDYMLWHKRKIAADVLSGGKADDKPSSDFSSEQIAMGKKVEKEHTNSDELAEEIARDHLEEIPDYYTRLKKMEDEAKEKKASWSSEARNIEIGPPPTPNRKEYPFVGTIHFNGLIINVENAPGDVREGKDPSGRKWRTEMKLPYGEIQGTLGVDRDKLDAYVGPHSDAENVYIVHQNKVGGSAKGTYDEDKVMLGFDSPEQAKEAYLAHYSNPAFFRSMTVMSISLFKKALRTKEVHGEKVATSYSCMMEKSAHDMRLEDLFAGNKTASHRMRMWVDKESGRRTTQEGSGMGSWDKTKTASVPNKIAAQFKSADMDKEVLPDKSVGRVAPVLSADEPSIPPEILEAMSRGGMESALATPSLMGMVLKPEEFQRLVLECNGRGDVANDLDSRHSVFSPVEEEEPLTRGLNESDFSNRILEQLLPLMERRSYHGPVVRRRVIRILIRDPKPVERPINEETSPLLSKIGAAYNWYRKQQVKLASSASGVIAKNPSLQRAILGVDEVDLFKGASLSDVDPKLLGIMAGSIPLSLMYSAHLRQERDRGVDLPMWKDLIADHPLLSTVGSLTGLRKLLQTPQGRQAVEELVSAGKRIWTGAPSSVSPA